MAEPPIDDVPEEFDVEENVVVEPVPLNLLENNVVRLVFFENCDLADLPRLRLVCREWYHMSLRRFRNNFVVKISEDVENGKWRIDKSLGFRDVDSLYSLPQIEDFPLRRFDISVRARPQEDYQESLVQYLPPLEAYIHFWDTFGTWIHHLNIYADGNLLEDWTLETWLMNKTPNLESLKLDTGRSMREWWVADAVVGLGHSKLHTIDLNCDTVPWSDIIRSFPNLQKILINKHFERDVSAILAALMEQEEEKSSPRKLELINLDITASFQEARDLLTEAFNCPRIRLQNFKLCCVLDVRSFQECLTIVLNNMTGPSQSLWLGECINGLEPIEDLFRGERLFISKLTIDCRLVRNLDFLANLPKLNEASLYHCDLVKLDESNTLNVEPLENLKTVRIELFRQRILRSSDVRLVAAYAPNLVDFSGSLDNVSFSILCTLLPNIRHLNIIQDASSDVLDDEGITGILDGGTRHGGHVLAPNITNLIKLRTFYCGSSILTSGSIWNGFLKLDHLHTVNLTLHEETSDEAFFALFTKCPGKTLRRRSDGLEGSRHSELNKRLKQISKNLP